MLSLGALLDEAVERATKIVAERHTDPDDEAKARMGDVVRERRRLDRQDRSNQREPGISRKTWKRADTEAGVETDT